MEAKGCEDEAAIPPGRQGKALGNGRGKQLRGRIGKGLACPNARAAKPVEAMGEGTGVALPRSPHLMR
jgi:hypothetical protein